MFNNIFKKTIYEKRWMLVGWSIVVLLFTIFIVVVFPVFRDTMGDSLQNVPDSLKKLFGDAETFQNLNAFIDVQVIYQMVFMPIIMGIILCAGLIAGKEEQGTMQSLLAQPVKRRRVYLDMLFSSWLLIGIVSFVIFIGCILGGWFIGESVNGIRLSQACVATWLVSLVVSTFAYALGAITAKKGFAGMLTGVIVFFLYVVTALEPSVHFLKYPNYLSPFKYFNTPSVMLNGWQWYNIVIMAVTTLVFAIIGYFVFTRRDVYQK